MVAPQAKYRKIAQLIKNPFDPVTAKIIGGAGGLLAGLSIAGSVVAHGNLSVPAVIAVFVGFAVSGSLVGLGIISYAARNSASLSTIVFAMAGADFAGAFGAIAATACVSVTNTVIYGITGMTIDDMLADGLVASINGVDQIIQDSREAVASMPSKTKNVSNERTIAKEVSIPQNNIPQPQKVIEQNVQAQLAAAKPQKPRKSFAEKLNESRKDTKSLKPKKPKDTFKEKLEEGREASKDDNLIKR